MHLVMFETHGNQHYVFASPRLKENIGASYLLTQLEPWVRSASQQKGITLVDVSVSSGKVIVAVDSEDTARTLVGAVTRTALETAPGVDVTGVFIPMTSAHVMKEDLEKVHAESASYALTRPPASARFCSMSFLEPGRDTLVPAVPSQASDASREVYSLPSAVARAEASTAREHLISLASSHPKLMDRSEQLLPNLDALEKALDSLSKVAIIHLDGNGVGAMVRSLADRLTLIPSTVFQEQIKCDAADPDALRLTLLALNKSLDDVMKGAFGDAWAAVADLAAREGVDVVPVVPVILGGDDATVITDGAFALPFAEAFLEAFEERTDADPVISSLSDDGKMTAGAGVAVVRHNFPFHLAYDLAERLASWAKATGKRMDEPCSTLSYHILYDSTVLHPEELIASYAPFACEAETAQGVPAMTARPYRVLPGKEPTLPLSPPSANESWNAMRLRAAWFAGVCSAPGALAPMRFPKSRAARIRKILSDAAHLSGREQRAHLAQASSEWNTAQSQRDLRVLADAIGSERLMLDLIDLAELLPRTYLAKSVRLAASASEELS